MELGRRRVVVAEAVAWAARSPLGRVEAAFVQIADSDFPMSPDNPAIRERVQNVEH
jgi:hypothetical protein